MAPAVAAGRGDGLLIVGGGLAGGLLALELRRLGLPVLLVDAPAPDSPTMHSATSLSYGALPGWPLAAGALARLAAGASDRWRRLQRLHGGLGWRPCRLRLHGPGPLPGGLARLLPLPFAQVDTAQLTSRLPAVLAAAGVHSLPQRVLQLQPGRAGGWQVELADGAVLLAEQVVLAAGAGCRALWPALPCALRSSWAAVLALEAWPASVAPGPGGAGRQGACLAQLPAAFSRMALERRAADLERPEWVVDAGLVPWGSGALLGQLSLVRPGLELGPPPAAAQAEHWLREGLREAGAWGPAAAALPGRLALAPVAFSLAGMPLVGALPQAPGLWLFTGFSAGFSQVPVLAPLLAQALAAAAQADRQALQIARQPLERLGVWPQPQAPAPPGPPLAKGRRLP